MKESPGFWIEELRILRSWSLDAAEEVRRIPFRRGLNIIWADASESPSQELPGFGGHAAGKTSLCRLVRYLLGEPHYGSKFMRDRIGNAFSNGWAVAKIWVGDTPWIVARAFRSGARPRSCMGDSIEVLFASDDAPGPYDDFRKALHDAVIAPLPLREFPSEEDPITFLHLLEWFARDQECRLSGLLEWRHPSSNHDCPGMSAEQRRFLIRTTLDLVDDLVRQEIEKRHKLEVELARIPDDLAYRRRTLHDHLAALQDDLVSEDIPKVDGPLFVDAVKRISFARRDTAFSQLDEKINNLALTEKRSELSRLNLDLGAKRYQQATLQKELDGAATAFQEAQRDGTEAGYVRFWEKLSPGDQFCKIPIEVARFRCKLRQEHEPAPAHQFSTPIKESLEAKAAAAREKIQSLKQGLNPITTACDQLAEALGKLTRAISAAETARDLLLRKRNEVEKTNTLTLFHAEQAASLSKAIENLESRQGKLDHDIEQSKKRQETMQKRRKRQIADFSSLYESSLKAVLGGGIEGACHFTREEIDLRAEYHGELSSAAIDTLKTIAFDIAALRSGIEEQSRHPGFLLLDSPREADMHPTPYRKIFHHLKDLESLAKEPPFQVIITTTEPPPPVLQAAPELILRLDASTKDGRVYRRDF
jgi:hypothetical protein